MLTIDTLPDTFIERGQQLRTFRETHGRLPVQCDAADPSENNLGTFLRSHRGYLSRPDRVTDGVIGRAEWLDANVPDWRTDNRRPLPRRPHGITFETRVAQVVQYVQKHHRLPRTTGSPWERQLGRFLMNQRQAKKGRGTTAWSEGRGRLLDKEVPGWDSPLDAAAR